MNTCTIILWLSVEVAGFLIEYGRSLRTGGMDQRDDGVFRGCSPHFKGWISLVDLFLDSPI